MHAAETKIKTLIGAACFYVSCLYPFLRALQLAHDKLKFDDRAAHVAVVMYFIATLSSCINNLRHQQRYLYEYSLLRLRKFGVVIVSIADVWLFIGFCAAMYLLITKFNASIDLLLTPSGSQIFAGSGARNLMSMLSGVLGVPALLPIPVCHCIFWYRSMQKRSQYCARYSKSGNSGLG